MQSSDIPTKLDLPFAASGTKTNPVPDPSQVGIVDGAASFTTGFPPLTFIPVSSGGIPPSGADMNGILYMISAWTRWLNAGGPLYYDAAFQTLVGGYPKGALLQKADLTGNLWLSTVENNMTDPDTSGVGWTALNFGGGGFGIGLGLRNDGSGNAETQDAVTNTAAGITLALADHTKNYTATAPLTIALFRGNLAGAFNGFYIGFDARGGAITLTPDVNDSIEGGTAGASVVVPQGSWGRITLDSSAGSSAANWQLKQAIVNTSSVPSFLLMDAGII